MAVNKTHHTLSMDDVLRSLLDVNESTSSGHADSSDEGHLHTPPSPTSAVLPSSNLDSFDEWITYLSLQTTTSSSEDGWPFANGSLPSSFNDALDRFMTDKENTSDTHATPPPSPSSPASSFDWILDQHFTSTSRHHQYDSDGDGRQGR
ncbi:hypothetical protein JVT61DRAFT_1382 [Boletus reticuloceps]|uniref:Uncharacterized protein n=1 Tax=Boletus reticuloceps TaxID=495285 RepID=A0A8I2YC10_9AGAM|nr:hypothetical protein JVT61DRAFT_1890 [Boletus reticuloceps]KAG6369066.1 hypothetical protein JVT61DRAFT_1893 [Boletus reticuloceps]KAG6369154.1 hypothetical protein JVT61DRAFT_1382 [Boletus reticuloceps]